MISPSIYERPDRIKACPYPHVADCGACGFDGIHRRRTEPLEARQYRARCTCAWRGPIRRSVAESAADCRHH
jgi:hypothetical protein